MSKPGDDLEKIVEIVERSIAPDAKIERNMFLPILNSRQGHTAQCDVVIRTGNPPRQTLTIVEVQDRNSQVDINTFRGWMKKVEDVGAQHLICVSRKDFPSSVKEQVELSGSKVFLVMLKELGPTKIPLDFIKLIYQYRHFDVLEIKDLRPWVGPGQMKEFGLSAQNLGLNDKTWSLDRETPVSLFELFRQKIESDHAFTESNGISEAEASLSFNLSGPRSLYFLHEQEFIRVGLECRFRWRCEHIERPMSVASYEQDQHGTLAWVFEVTHDSLNGKISTKVPLTKLSNGNFQLLDTITNIPFPYSTEIRPV